MKAKILMILLTAFLISAGTAAAYDANLWNEAGTQAVSNPIQLLPGETINLSYHAENILPGAIGQDLAYEYEVTAVSGGAQVSDVTVVLPANFTPTSTPYTDVGVVQITLDVNATPGAFYNIEVGAGTGQADVGAAARGLDSIPEFPTVALPIAAILGLAFIIQRRREE